MAGFVLFGLCDTLGVAQSQVFAKFKRSQSDCDHSHADQYLRICGC